MKLTDVERRVRQVPWPAPSPELRTRVLSEASLVRRPVTWSDRVWFSRTWRLSMAAAALILVTIDQLSGPRGTAGLAPTPQALAEAQAIEETGREVGLPPELAASLARRALAVARPRAIDVHAWPALQLFDEGGEGR